MPETLSWTREAWREALPVYNDIIAHPFIKELASGTPATERFDRYLAQDEVYIGNYGRQMFETWYKMGAMVEAGLDLTPMITHRFNYRDFEKGFEAMNSGASGKVVLDWTK